MRLFDPAPFALMYRQKIETDGIPIEVQVGGDRHSILALVSEAEESDLFPGAIPDLLDLKVIFLAEDYNGPDLKLKDRLIIDGRAYALPANLEALAPHKSVCSMPTTTVLRS